MAWHREELGTENRFGKLTPSNGQLAKTNAYREAMGFPRDKGGRWDKSFDTDTYNFTYTGCGHRISIPGAAMQTGQMAPPICPVCHVEKLDQMEAANWRQDAKWPGYSVYKTEGASVATYTTLTHTTLGSARSWLEGELGRVTEMAWR